MSALLPPRALSFLASIALASTLDAQGVVAGVVRDSTAGARPLAGATVQLAAHGGAGVWTAVTDSTGAFRFADVPAGRHLLGFFHARADSLLVNPPLRLLEVADGAVLRTELALPAPSTIVAAVCGVAGDSAGVFLGHLRDAASGLPLGGGELTVTWHELVIGGGARQERRLLRATADGEGRFGVCGIPTDAPVVVQAAAGPLASGLLELHVLPGAVLARDVHLGPVTTSALDEALVGVVEPPRRGAASLAGRVLGADGAPRARAVVSLQGSAATDTTDDAGAFRLDSLPAGSHTVEARAIGVLPARLAVDLADGRVTTAELSLGARLPSLDAVTVYGQRTRRGELAGFLQRARGGFGHFLTAADVERRPAAQVADLLRMVPGVRVTPSSAGDVILVRGGAAGVCEPTIFLDGMPVQEGATTISQLVRPQEIGGIEVYAGGAGMPVQYQRGSCGSVVIWTRLAL